MPPLDETAAAFFARSSYGLYFFYGVYVVFIAGRCTILLLVVLGTVLIGDFAVCRGWV